MLQNGDYIQSGDVSTIPKTVTSVQYYATDNYSLSSSDKTSTEPHCIRLVFNFVSQSTAWS